jgi:hypothetical protein
MSMSRAEFHQFLNNPAFSEIDAVLRENAGLVDDLLTESALEAQKQRIDETFQRAIKTFWAKTESRREA